MPIAATDIKMKKTGGRHYGLMLAVDDRPLCPHARASLRAAVIWGSGFENRHRKSGIVVLMPCAAG
jgi:hypothetical protein